MLITFTKFNHFFHLEIYKVPPITVQIAKLSNQQLEEIFYEYDRKAALTRALQKTTQIVLEDNEPFFFTIWDGDEVYKKAVIKPITKVENSVTVTYY